MSRNTQIHWRFFLPAKNHTHSTVVFFWEPSNHPLRKRPCGTGDAGAQWVRRKLWSARTGRCFFFGGEVSTNSETNKKHVGILGEGYIWDEILPSQNEGVLSYKSFRKIPMKTNKRIMRQDRIDSDRPCFFIVVFSWISFWCSKKTCFRNLCLQKLRLRAIGYLNSLHNCERCGATVPPGF